MPTTQTAKNMPYPLGNGPQGHSRPTSSPISSDKQRGAPNRLHTEAYEYDGMSNKMPPAGEYLRAPVCCSECEEFWKALILEVDEKHTSRMPAGKASLIMAKGASGRLSVLQIKSTKQHVTKERRFLPGLGCRNVTVRGDAFHSSGDAARHISTNTTSIKSGHRYHEPAPEKKLNIRTTRSNRAAPAYGAYGSYAANQSGLSSEPSRQTYKSQGDLHRDAVGYKNAYGAAPKYDVISTPRRLSHGYGRVPGTDRRKSAVYPEPPEVSPSFVQTRSHRSEASPAYRPEAISGGQAYFKSIRTRVDGDHRPEERFKDLHTPRRYTPMYSESSPFPRSLHHPFFADSSQFRPFPPPATTRFPEQANSQAPSRERFSHPRMYSSVPLTSRAPSMQENQTEDFLHGNYPPKRDTQNYTEHRMSDSTGEKTSTALRQSNNNTYGFDKASPPSQRDDFLSSATAPHQNRNPSPNSYSGRVNKLDIPSVRTLSRTSTIESDYTTLSVPRSDCSASSNSQDLGNDSPRSNLARARNFNTETLRPRDLKEANNAASDPGIGVSFQKSPQRLQRPGPLNNLSRTSTGTSSLMDPIVLFTGHACRSETDENSETENDDVDIAVRNPNYFKHIITNPNYLKRIVKPLHALQPPPPPPSFGSNTMIPLAMKAT